MKRNGRIGPAVVAGLTWAVVAGAMACAVVVWLMNRPSTRIEPGGETIYLKGAHGPGWDWALASGGVLGIAAGFSGTVWRLTRPV